MFGYSRVIVSAIAEAARRTETTHTSLLPRESCEAVSLQVWRDEATAFISFTDGGWRASSRTDVCREEFKLA